METVSAGSQIDTRGLAEPRMGAAEQSGGFEGKHAKGESRQKNTPHLAGYVVWPVGLDLRAYLAGICSST